MSEPVLEVANNSIPCKTALVTDQAKQSNQHAKVLQRACLPPFPEKSTTPEQSELSSLAIRNFGWPALVCLGWLRLCSKCQASACCIQEYPSTSCRRCLTMAAHDACSPKFQAHCVFACRRLSFIVSVLSTTFYLSSSHLEVMVLQACHVALATPELRGRRHCNELLNASSRLYLMKIMNIP